MKQFPPGGRIFEFISRYDDLLTLASRSGYEPGDTLALIAPFLVYHGIKEHDISALARKATLTPGSIRLISWLSIQGWKIFCISTSYEQYARRVAHRVGIFSQNVASTSFPLDKFSSELSKENFRILDVLEKDISSKNALDDNWIKKRLDRFYWKELPETRLGEVVQQVKPVGGQRKVAALKQFAQAQNQPLSTWVAVGDSITDFKMLQAVDKAGGLAIAFNANEYALPHATIGLASTHLDDLKPVLQTWQKGKRPGVEKLIREKEKAGGSDNRGYFHWLSGIKTIAAPLQVHKRIRRIIREEAANLG
jgi:energy-converting hydrogenase A subunit R